MSRQSETRDTQFTLHVAPVPDREKPYAVPRLQFLLLPGTAHRSIHISHNSSIDWLVPWLFHWLVPWLFHWLVTWLFHSCLIRLSHIGYMALSLIHVLWDSLTSIDSCLVRFYHILTALGQLWRQIVYVRSGLTVYVRSGLWIYVPSGLWIYVRSGLWIYVPSGLTVYVPSGLTVYVSSGLWIYVPNGNVCSLCPKEWVHVPKSDSMSYAIGCAACCLTTSWDAMTLLTSTIKGFGEH